MQASEHLDLFISTLLFPKRETETNGRNHNDTDLKCVVQMDDTGETYGNILTNHTKNTNTNVF